MECYKAVIILASITNLHQNWRIIPDGKSGIAIFIDVLLPAALHVLVDVETLALQML